MWDDGQSDYFIVFQFAMNKYSNSQIMKQNFNILL
jgi:hypothetical protein